MLKNPTPSQVALLTSFTVVGVFMLFYGLFSSWVNSRHPVFSFLLMGGVLHLLTYFVMMYFLQRFIYRRIKIIYKNIHKFKLSKDEKFTVDEVDDGILDDVEREVEEWVEGQAREIQHLQSLEAYRRDYLGNVSHELKTPIFNIQGYLHTLLDGGMYDENINVTYLERAAKNTERLKVIIEDLDAISKLESGKLALEMVNFDIKELAASVLDELEMMAREQGVTLQFKEGADKGYQVNADLESIRQVLVNLVANSIKYGREGGTTKVSFYDMDKYILVEISDNGLGISPQHLPHVFDRFYRADKSRSRIQGGSGLGLSIVKHILEAHQQTVNVRSTPALGSTFGFTLEKA